MIFLCKTNKEFMVEVMGGLWEVKVMKEDDVLKVRKNLAFYETNLS